MAPGGRVVVGSFCAGVLDGVIWHTLAGFGVVWRGPVRAEPKGCQSRDWMAAQDGRRRSVHEGEEWAWGLLCIDPVGAQPPTRCINYTELTPNNQGDSLIFGVGFGLWLR